MKHTRANWKCKLKPNTFVCKLKSNHQKKKRKKLLWGKIKWFMSLHCEKRNKHSGCTIWCASKSADWFNLDYSRIIPIVFLNDTWFTAPGSVSQQVPPNAPATKIGTLHNTAAGRPAVTAPVLSSPLKYEHTWQSRNDSSPRAASKPTSIFKSPFLNTKDGRQRGIMEQPRCNTRKKKNKHSEVEALQHANSELTLCTNWEVSLLGPWVNSPHNTTTRLGTMWAARLLIPDKSLSVE